MALPTMSVFISRVLMISICASKQPAKRDLSSTSAASASRGTAAPAEANYWSSWLRWRWRGLMPRSRHSSASTAAWRSVRSRSLDRADVLKIQSYQDKSTTRCLADFSNALSWNALLHVRLSVKECNQMAGADCPNRACVPATLCSAGLRAVPLKPSSHRRST